MSRFPPIARIDQEKLSPERLRAVASTAEGRLQLTRELARLNSMLAEYREHANAQIASFEEIIGRINAAMLSRGIQA